MLVGRCCVRDGYGGGSCAASRVVRGVVPSRARASGPLIGGVAWGGVWACIVFGGYCPVRTCGCLRRAAAHVCSTGHSKVGGFRLRAPQHPPNSTRECRGLTGPLRFVSPPLRQGRVGVLLRPSQRAWGSATHVAQAGRAARLMACVTTHTVVGGESHVNAAGVCRPHSSSSCVAAAPCVRA